MDGWVEETVYEVCLFHGCPDCYRPKIFNPLKCEPMSETFRKHTIRVINTRNCKEVKHLVEIRKYLAFYEK